eukprot:UN08258
MYIQNLVARSLNKNVFDKLLNIVKTTNSERKNVIVSGDYNVCPFWSHEDGLMKLLSGHDKTGDFSTDYKNLLKTFEPLKLTNFLM